MKAIVVAPLIGAISAVKIIALDNSDPLGRNVDPTTWEDMHISGYNGADEDEIMDNVYGHYSKEGRTPSGHKTGQKLLMKDDAKLAANFESSWDHFDQNHEGWIRYEESHTFQRHL